MSDARYRDLENLLFLGFIPLKVKLGDMNLVFKSLNEIEYEQVRQMSGIKDDPWYNINFHLNYLFYSIYMVNGVNILKNRFEHYSEVTDVFRTYPYVLIKTMFNSMDELVKRVDLCTRQVEPYSYENNSRYNWSFNKGVRLNDLSQTGVPGTEFLGLNQFQKYWIVLNAREDSKESFDSQYSLFKFLASFTDSKSVKKIDGSDKARAEEEKKRRERVRVIGTPEESRYLSNPTETAEQLVEALNRQMRGEKDEHDKVIEDYETALRRNMLKQVQEMKEMQEERNKNKDLFVVQQVRPISPEEMAERISKSRNRYKNHLAGPVDHASKEKYFQMSNVKKEDVIVLDSPPTVVKPIPKRTLEEIEKEHKLQQQKLAFKYGFDDEAKNIDFPNLRKK